MSHKTLHLTISLLLLSLALYAAEPYATITYAEGTSFTLIRNQKAANWQVSAPEVFGMTIESGDLIVTEKSTFLEIRIHPISASVQIAENTSFRCQSEGDGTKSSGELLYGRVRAKVAKLSGTSSYKISSPSLVAGVRGTDFGLDLIAVRPTANGAKTAGQSTAPILNRVFCFEGSVAVTETAQSAAEPVLLEKNEMVERLVTALPATSPDEPVKIEAALQKKAVSEEVTNFWKPHPLSPDLISLAGGNFNMGSPETERFRGKDETLRQETVQPFLINKYETNQAEWTSMMGYNPSIYKSPSYPVENISWYEAIVYCNKRSLKEGLTPCYSLDGSVDPETWGSIPRTKDEKWNGMVCDFNATGYRLPTEAEWEYACRAGSDTQFNTGGNIHTGQANYNGQFQNNLNLEGEFRKTTLPVGIFRANAFGLFDMHGNVGEWCWDAIGTDMSTRAVRGGGWNDYGHFLRSAARKKDLSHNRSSGVGFRVVIRP